MNVFDFGAKGDGVNDDTAAIQAAIDFAAERGGGRILFPYTKGGYRIASPGREEYEGRPLRSQLVIPPGKASIFLEGEMPCRLLNAYMVRPLSSVEYGLSPTVFGARTDNTRIFSDWRAPEEHDPAARPWSIISAPEGEWAKGHFSVLNFSVSNLEFAVALDREKMYPTMSAANLQNVSRVHVSDSQFCLNDSVGDTLLDKELLHNPCHTAGLVTSGDQNDDNTLHNVAVQGFSYGFVCGEHVVADYLYIHNCEEGLTFHDCSHLSVINHIVAQHNAVIVSAAPDGLFGMAKGPCNVLIGTVNFECGTGLKPEVDALKYGVFDPEKRLHGSLCWHKPWGKQEFPVVCGEKFSVTQF
ncbi:MAG: hypothetical protein IJV00_00415 [Clostridia bacterium]|nr:hypothetical protein [Clostridia bacterium]